MHSGTAESVIGGQMLYTVAVLGCDWWTDVIHSGSAEFVIGGQMRCYTW